MSLITSLAVVERLKGSVRQQQQEEEEAGSGGAW